MPPVSWLILRGESWQPGSGGKPGYFPPVVDHVPGVSFAYLLIMPPVSWLILRGESWQPGTPATRQEVNPAIFPGFMSAWGASFDRGGSIF